MRAEVLTKDKYSKWDEFSYSHPYSSIHQTSRWAHFQSNIKARDKFWVIGIFKDGEKTDLVAGTVLIRHKMPKGYTWLYAPRGPLLDYDNPEIAHKQMNILLNKIKEIAKDEKTIFFRIDPLIEIKNSIKPISTNPQFDPEKSLHFSRFKFSHLGYQPEDTLFIDITKAEDEILAQMKEKGRYNIRLAIKKGVQVEEVEANSPQSERQIKEYYKILQETLERDSFHGHGISFYKNMVEKLAPKKEQTTNPYSQLDKKTGFSKMFIAYFADDKTEKKTPLAGIIATFYKDTGIYYFGASSNAYRNLMAPYLLQWHAIQTAKTLGLEKYDLLGVAPETPKDPLGPKNHKWRGVTEFKRKFGGYYVKYLPPQEYIFRPFIYFGYILMKKLRGIFR